MREEDKALARLAVCLPAACSAGDRLFALLVFCMRAYHLWSNQGNNNAKSQVIRLQHLKTVSPPVQFNYNDQCRTEMQGRFGKVVSRLPCLFLWR